MRPGYRAWTEAEETRLREMVAAGESREALACALARSLDAVNVRAGRLGLVQCFDHGGVWQAQERWGKGKPDGGAYWTAERTEEALRALIRRTRGLLPAGHGEWYDVKRGDPDLPIFPTLRRHLMGEDYPTLGHVWLRLDAPRGRVKLLGGRWTEAEIDYLMSAAGSLTLNQIAARLHRTYAACRRKLYDLGIKARDNQGYMSAQQVAAEYGCEVGRVQRFIRESFLPARLMHGNRYAIDPVDAERLRLALSAPPSRGKGWTVADDGTPVPPRTKPVEPEFITRYRSTADRLRGVA